ncbi:ATP-binding protein [Blastomonas sp.]|uniref:ATP-binding protein n=1 Tax=Blastomonas sp. TaxID=1909299 RepID=UPI0035940CC2
MEHSSSTGLNGGRFLFATGLLVVGVTLSQVASSSLEQAMICFASGLVALVAMVDLSGPAKTNPQAAAPIREPENKPISQHRDFTSFIDGLADPVLVLTGTNVRRANSAARKLLGEYCVGEDIRLVIRHPAAADFLTDPNHAPGNGPIQLVGIGSRDQRWEMQVRDIPGGERILFLWDRSGMYAVERMRTDFVANASHELRTPLASIKGFIETLEDSEAGDDPEVRKRFLNVMFREANRMQKLIEDLISLSRIEADKFRVPDTPVNLPELMREVQTVFAQSHGERGKDVVLDIDDDLPPMRGDRAQLSQVLHNLVSNSMKYGQAGTPVTLGLHASRNGALIRLSVSDCGEGIAPEHLPRLTERFYRVDSSRSRAIGGTGLGLSIVKHVVERHRGRLEIDSALQRGTSVTITLPADPRVAAVLPASSPEAAPA